MKLGTQTNSVMNHLYSRMTKGEPAPVVGMGCTFLAWTDRYAGTIYKVSEIGGSKLWSCEIEASYDRSVLVSGSRADGSDEYGYQSVPTAPRRIFRKERKSGQWVEVRLNTQTGRYCKTGGMGLRIGARDEYQDPSF